MLGISSKDYPELKLKAWTNRVMTAFLVACMEQACLQRNSHERLVLACAVVQKLSKWLLQVEICPRYLTTEQATYMNALANEQLDILLYIHVQLNFDFPFKIFVTPYWDCGLMYVAHVDRLKVELFL